MKHKQIQICILIVFIALLLGSFSLHLAGDTFAAGIFGGSSNNNSSSGIFGNFSERIRTIFQGRQVELGGSAVPYIPSVPLPPGPGDPPLPNGGEYLKAWVEWDTMYKGLTVPPGIIEEDPLAPLHIEYITGSEGGPTGDEPQHGCCPTCGDTVTEVHHALWGWCGGEATVNGQWIPTPDGAVTSVQTDSAGPNDEILPAAIPNKIIRRDGYAYKCVQNACYVPTPTPTVPPGEPTPTPTVGPPVCNWGCGYLGPEYTCVPDGTCPDGWACQEPLGCEDPPPAGPAERWNYIEFQSMIYHSNDFEIDFCIQNVGTTTIDNITIYRHSREGYEWPHNVALGENPVSSQNTVLGAPYVPMEYHHGDTYTAIEEDINTPLEPEEIRCFNQHHDHFSLARDRILSVPATFPKVGYNSPRDYNFICEEGAGEGERCGSRQLVLERPLTDEEYYRYFFEVRDVTEQGGCGYNASSNNSVLGPITYEVQYGGEPGEARSSRSVVLASIPIGNPLDDEAQPFGWPASGVITEDWGNTGLAQAGGLYRNLQTGGRLEYDEYLYCVGEGDTYPIDGRPRAGDYLHPGIDIGPPTSTAQPSNVYTTHAGYVTFAGYDPGHPDKGYTVQIETDFNRDRTPDAVTRYSHLLPGSLQIDVIDRGNPFSPNGTRWEFGSGHYVARNTLIGKMGDSGSPGDTHIQYEILTTNPINPNVLPIHGNIGGERCTDNPYSLGCWVTDLESQFFSKLRFRPNLVLGPVYVNPT